MSYELFSHPAWLDDLPIIRREQVQRFIAIGNASDEFLDWLDDNPDIKELIDAETDRRIGEAL